MPVKFYGADDTDPGEWREWRPGINVKVRRITPAKERSIENRYLGTKRRVRFRQGVPEQDLDVRKSEEVSREKAIYCMVETEGFELDFGGPQGAESLSKLLNEKYQEGQVVSLDGRWTDVLKGAIFDGLPDLMNWVVEQAQEMMGRAREEDEEVEGN
jgi:hypothetical protein